MFSRVLAILSSGILFGVSIYYCHGYLDAEAPGYLTSNLRPIWLFANVFDIGANDFSIFRARELSYFFNILDAKFIELSFAWGVPHYLSIVYYLCLIIVCGLQLLLGSRFLKITWIQNLLMVLICLSSPVVFMSGYYFRTSKILVGAFGFTIAWILIAHPRMKAWVSIVSIGLLSTAMTLCDEQGVLLAMYFTVLTFVWDRFRPNPTMKRLCASFLVSLALYGCYRLFIGPFLVSYFSHPSLSAKVEAERMPDLRDLIKFDVRNGLVLTWRWFYFLFGGNSLFAIPALGLFIFAARSKISKFPTWVLVGTAVLFVLANSMMATRHPFILMGMVSRVYYGLPFTLLLLPLFTLTLEQVAVRLSSRAGLVTAFLMVLFIGNLTSIPGHVNARRTEFEAVSHTPYGYLGTFFRECVLENRELRHMENVPQQAWYLCKDMRKTIRPVSGTSLDQ